MTITVASGTLEYLTVAKSTVVRVPKSKQDQRYQNAVSLKPDRKTASRPQVDSDVNYLISVAFLISPDRN